MWESARYGAVSKAEDSIFDHPFQWGSRRIGPDLARVGGRYSNLWHYTHMLNPRDITPGSNMPNYSHLASETLDFDKSAEKLRAMRSIGVPYTPEQITHAAKHAAGSANIIAEDLRKEGAKEIVENSRLIALIAYLQRLGKNESTQAETKEPKKVQASTQKKEVAQ